MLLIKSAFVGKKNLVNISVFNNRFYYKETKSESKIQKGVERERTVYWKDIVKGTAPVALPIQQKVTATPRLLFVNYNEVVWWPYHRSPLLLK